MAADLAPPLATSGCPGCAHRGKGRRTRVVTRPSPCVLKDGPPRWPEERPLAPGELGVRVAERRAGVHPAVQVPPLGQHADDVPPGDDVDDETGGRRPGLRCTGSGLLGDRLDELSLVEHQPRPAGSSEGARRATVYRAQSRPPAVRTKAGRASITSACTGLW